MITVASDAANENRMVNRKMASKKGKKTSNYNMPHHADKRSKTHRLIRQGIKRGDSPQTIYQNLKDKGLGYRKQNALADIRLKNATINAKSPQARKNSENWFLNVFEPFREKHKMNSSQAKKIWEKSVEQSYETIEQARLGQSMRSSYRSQFRRAPSETVNEG